MRKLVGILILSLLLSTAAPVLGSQDSSEDDPVSNHPVSNHRQRRSMIFFPSGSSEEKEDEEEPPPSGLPVPPYHDPVYEIEDTTDLIKAINDSYEGENLDQALLYLKEAFDEDAMGRSIGIGSPQAKIKRRRQSTSMLGAAINALNPISYVRGSFNGFRNTFMQNIRPFKRRFGIKSRDQRIQKVKNGPGTTERPVKTSPQQPSSHQNLQSDSQIPSSSNIASSSVASPSHSQNSNQENGLDLKIPPELVNYAALEVNLKPNGDINIVPVTAHPNLKGGKITSPSSNDQHGSNLSNYNRPNRHIPTKDNYSSETKLGGNANSGSNGTLYDGTYSNIYDKNTHQKPKRDGFKPSKIVKLVTDRPVIVESIQDILNSGALFKRERDKNTSYLHKNPVPVDFTSLYNNPAVDHNAQLHFPSLDQTPSPDHIYLLPFRVNKKRDSFRPVNPPRRYDNPNYSQKSDDASEIYYIDITIPEEHNAVPIVSHQRVTPPKRGFNRKRSKRDTTDKPEEESGKETPGRSGRFLDYDGWQPLDVADPMSNEPTLIYKPPPLERVHFGSDPPEDKPLYPVVPINPPVYVIRAETPEKEIHSVYGTENVDYLHVNPKTNSAKAFSAFGQVFRDKNDQERNAPPKSDRNEPPKSDRNEPPKSDRNAPPKIDMNKISSFSLSDIIQNFIKNDIKPNSSDESTNITATITTTTNSTTILPTNGTLFDRLLANETELQKDTINASSNEAQLPVMNSTDSPLDENNDAKNDTVDAITKDKVSEDENEFKVEIFETFGPLEDLYERGSKFRIKERNPDSEFSSKSLALEDDVFLPEEDQDNANDGDNYIAYDDLLMSASDPFASILPKDPVVDDNGDDQSENSGQLAVDSAEDDIYIASGSEVVERKSEPRASLYELLKDFDGVQYDPYIFSASETNENSYFEERTPHTFRSRQVGAPDEFFFIDRQPSKYRSVKSEKQLPYRTERLPSTHRGRTVYPRNFPVATGRNIGYTNSDANSRDWFLIETRSKKGKTGRRKPNKLTNRNNYFTDRQTSRYAESQNIYSPYLGGNINSLKSSESLTANSLSELLQIFKYVTTPNPVQKLSGLNAYQRKYKTFRYTKPTESPNRAKHFTTFRYTAPASKPATTTEQTTIQANDIQVPLRTINDSVAETNSLDGYLFSDSEAAPEYTNPEVRPNVIRIDSNNKGKGENEISSLHTGRILSFEPFKPQIINVREEKRSNKGRKYGESDEESNKEGESSKMDSDAVQRGEIAPPLVIEAKDSGEVLLEPYSIQQGHSKVRIFGTNSDLSIPESTTHRSETTTLDHILITPAESVRNLVTVLPPTTTPEPTMVDQDTNPEDDGKDRNRKYYNIDEFIERMDLDDQVVVKKDVSKWTNEDIDLQSSPGGCNHTLSNTQSPFTAFTSLISSFFPSQGDQKSKSSQFTDESYRKLTSLPTKLPFNTRKKRLKEWEEPQNTQAKGVAKYPFQYLAHLRLLQSKRGLSR